MVEITQVWRGNMAFVVKFARDWLGGWIFDLVLPRMFGLSRLKALLKAKSKRS
jgi:1-acylglycerone phosphate reductase